jgi:hypothetical protein
MYLHTCMAQTFCNALVPNGVHTVVVISAHVPEPLALVMHQTTASVLVNLESPIASGLGAKVTQLLTEPLLSSDARP